MKKLLSTLLASAVALTAIGGLAACDPSSGPTESYSGELTVWAPQLAHEGYQELIAKHKEFDNVTVTFIEKGEGDAADQIINDPEQSADVFFTESGQIPRLVANNILQPLVGPYASYANAVKANNSEGSVAGITMNNVVYGFPTTADNTWFMIYNEDYFTTAPTKLDDIVKKAEDEKKDVYFKYNDGWFTSAFFFAMGCTMDFVVDEGTGEQSYVTTVADENGVKAGKAIMKYLGTDNTVIKTSTEDYDDAVVTALNDGSAIVGFTGTWNLEKLKNTKLKYAMVPQFTLDGTDYQLRPFYGVKYCGVNIKRPNKKAAAALAALLTSEEGQKIRYDTTHALPTNKKVAESDAVQSDELAFLAEQNQIGYPQGDQPSEMYSSMVTFANNIANGTIDTDAKLQTALAQLAKDSYAADDE